MLQGSKQSLICSFVFDELPQIYKMVCDKKPKKIDHKNKILKSPLKPIVKCEQCKYKSSVIQMTAV